MVVWHRAILLLAATLLVAACADTPPLAPPGVVECGIGALTGPLASNPNTLQRAAQVYELVARGRDAIGAVEEVLGTTAGRFSPTQVDEALFILSGLSACGEVSPIARESAVSAIGLIRSIAGGRPSGARPGPALCPGLDPYGPPDSLRFEPDCGSPDIAGEWLLSRTELSCENFPKGCAATPIPIRFVDCTAAGCTVTRTDGVWSAEHALARSAGSLRGEFVDIGIECNGRRNRATITLDLTSTPQDPRVLRGTYQVAASTNPPDCPSDARATYSVVGRPR